MILELWKRNRLNIRNETLETLRSNPYFIFKDELTCCGDVLLRGTRLVIPETLRERTLYLAHQRHPEESLMKRRLRLKVWWPGLDREMETHVKKGGKYEPLVDEKDKNRKHPQL